MHTTATRIAAAIQNTAAVCPSADQFDPSTVEVHGIVPAAARGLLALMHEQTGIIASLQKQIQQAQAIAEGAKIMAQTIMIDEKPELADRSGFVICADWAYFAVGPSEKRRRANGELDVYNDMLHAEQRRAAQGNDDGVGASTGAGFPRGLGELLKGMSRKGRHRMQPDPAEED